MQRGSPPERSNRSTGRCVLLQHRSPLAAAARARRCGKCTRSAPQRMTSAPIITLLIVRERQRPASPHSQGDFAASKRRVGAAGNPAPSGVFDSRRLDARRHRVDSVPRYGPSFSARKLSELHAVGGLGFRGVARPFIVGYVDVRHGGEGAAVFTGRNYPF
jgi:hypothetical protein